MILKPQKFSFPSPGHQLSNGLIYSGLFNERSGDAVADSSGRGHIGTAQNGLWVPGKFGSALDFGGVNPELITNGDFSAWTTDDPDGWVVTGESGTDPEISEVGTGEGHGGVGTGMCNIYTSDGTSIRLSQELSNFVVGRKYELSINIDTVIAGGINVFSTSNAFSQLFTTSGVKTIIFVAKTTTDTLRILRSGATDITFDDVSVKAVLDYVTIPDHDDFTPAGTPMSIASWINMRDATTFPIATKGIYNGNGEWRFEVLSSDVLSFRRFDESVASCYIGRLYNTALTSYENQWIYVVATSDGGALSSGDKIYLNGVRVDDTNLESNPGSFVAVENLGADVLIGRYGGGYASGLFDNVMMWQRELSAGNVMSLYRNSFRMYDQDETELV